MHKRTLDISTCILLITHDRQRRTEKKKAQYFITQEVPPKCNYMYPQLLEHSPWLSRRRDLCPNSRCHGARDDTKTYVCIYIDGVCVHWMPDSMQCCHVWRLQSATSSCMTCGVSQRTAHCVRRCQIWLLQCCPIFVTAAVPNGRYQCCQLSCLGCLCRWKTVSFIGEGLACTCYQPQRVQDGQCKYEKRTSWIIRRQLKFRLMT